MTIDRRRALRLPLLALAAWVVVGVTLCSSPALAAEGTIDHIETRGGKVQVLYSLPGSGDAAPDLTTISLSLDGKPLAATAELATGADQAVRRTTVLAVDVSDSMKGAKFAAAKQAAQVFLDTAPSDLYVGIVTFAGGVTVAQQPTLDRTAASAVVDGLQLSYGTLLYPGIQKAVALGGKDGSRSIIVLSDGRDTSDVPLASVTEGIKRAGAKVDVVALAQSASEEALLQPLSDAGKGAVISERDPGALGKVFASEADVLAKQLLITAPAPVDATKEGTLAVSVVAGGESYTDEAFVTLPAPKTAVASPTDLRPAAVGTTVSSTVMLAGLGALGLGALVLVLALTGATAPRRASVESRIEVYTRTGSTRRIGSRSDAPTQGVAAQAVGFASKALKSNQGAEVKLGDRLDAAGMSLKPAEWLLMHAGIAFGVAILLLVLTGGSLLLTLVGLLGGVFVPWLYLGMKRSRRLKAFNAQLAGCLQLIAGSLQAGLSLAQALDTVVREGTEPLSGEFRRALVETRLGVPIEEALESIGQRMESPDFTWTVMAIRIQREVGGNLAELLLNVAATLREREYLRRQVKSLSAEGRFSAYILLGLPVVVIGYMMLSNPVYVQPLVSTPIGWVMLAGMAILMVLGAVTMTKLIKVEV